MVNKEVVRKRLNKLDEYLAILYRMQDYSFEAFIGNPERYGSAERFLHLAIEAINDIGNHIIADGALGNVDSYSDIPSILQKQGLIDQEMQEKWIKIIGFRNTLVHEYIEIDRNIVYQVLQNDLQDLETLIRIFAQFLYRVLEYCLRICTGYSARPADTKMFTFIIFDRIYDNTFA